VEGGSSELVLDWSAVSSLAAERVVTLGVMISQGSSASATDGLFVNNLW